MSDFSLLYSGEIPKYNVLCPNYIIDLKLDGIINAIISKYREFPLIRYFYTLPESENTVIYRQEIFKDLENNPRLLKCCKSFTGNIIEMQKTLELAESIDDPVKKGSYLLISGRHYCNAINGMQRELSQADIKSTGLLELRNILQKSNEDVEFESFSTRVDEAYGEFKKLRITLSMNDNEIQVIGQEEEETTESVQARLEHFLEAFDVIPDEKKKKKYVNNIFPSPLETSKFEDLIVSILGRSNPEAFLALKKFASIKLPFGRDSFDNLKNELLFFVAIFEFEKQLNNFGYTLNYPQVDTEANLQITEVYDLALAWHNRLIDYNVVRNDVDYNGCNFLVITGPNQGGKTTLARAVGQTIYLTMLGFKAPCKAMITPVYRQLLTHFEVEESLESGAGKLKDELKRLKPMMLDNNFNNFVILNELFTTATTYDAIIMAKKVIDHFVDHKCSGIYVTHIKEIADEDEIAGIKSMVAQVDGSRENRRTYKILPMKAKGLGYSENVLKKYNLDLESLTKRLKNMEKGD
ncbi:MutS-related protein [Eubacterium xylanophilum]|uniref:MutS-related protein n=1 Tax=Eubacterium xylanophilum TaxID=39497 RepID=UPI00047C4FEF|nr:hypothetical protein [Eubacterium xylanophilum]